MGTIQTINAFLQEYSGIITSLLVILVFIGSLSKRFKGWIFKDIYNRLDKIENNDLRHIDLSQQRSTKIEDLILDVLAGITQKEEIADRRARIEIWYSGKMDILLSAQKSL